MWLQYWPIAALAQPFLSPASKCGTCTGVTLLGWIQRMEMVKYSSLTCHCLVYIKTCLDNTTFPLFTFSKQANQTLHLLQQSLNRDHWSGSGSPGTSRFVSFPTSTHFKWTVNNERENSSEQNSNYRFKEMCFNFELIPETLIGSCHFVSGERNNTK